VCVPHLPRLPFIDQLNSAKEEETVKKISSTLSRVHSVSPTESTNTPRSLLYPIFWRSSRSSSSCCQSKAKLRGCSERASWTHRDGEGVSVLQIQRDVDQGSSKLCGCFPKALRWQLFNYRVIDLFGTAWDLVGEDVHHRFSATRKCVVDDWRGWRVSRRWSSSNG
jgi:hypothetical protein